MALEWDTKAYVADIKSLKNRKSIVTNYPICAIKQRVQIVCKHFQVLKNINKVLIYFEKHICKKNFVELKSHDYQVFMQ